MLFLVNLQQDVAPRGRQSKVREGVGRLRLQPAAAEGQVVLVLEGDLRVAECLVHLKLLPLGHRARVVTVRRLHVFQQALRRGKREVLPRAALNLTHKIATVAAVRPPPPMHAEGRPAAVAALLPQSPVSAEGRSAAVAAPVPQSPVLAEGRPAAVATLPSLSPVLAEGRPAALTEPAVARARRPTTRRSRGIQPASARADRSTSRRSRGTAAAVARARRRTSRHTRDTGVAVARADTSSQAGALVALLNTLSVFSHVPASGDANERARIEAAV